MEGAPEVDGVGGFQKSDTQKEDAVMMYIENYYINMHKGMDDRLNRYPSPTSLGLPPSYTECLRVRVLAFSGQFRVSNRPRCRRREFDSKVGTIADEEEKSKLKSFMVTAHSNAPIMGSFLTVRSLPTPPDRQRARPSSEAASQSHS
jgi:hypothetical protein